MPPGVALVDLSASLNTLCTSVEGYTFGTYIAPLLP